MRFKQFCAHALLLRVAVGREFAPIIPNPNVCELKTTIRQGTWSSYDCPVDALCVPARHNSSFGFCSCSYTEDMFVTGDDGSCHPSTGTKIYAAFWCLLTVLCFWTCGVACWTIAITNKHGIAFTRAFTVLPVASLAASFFLGCNRVLRILQLVGDIPQRRKPALKTASDISLGITSFFLIAMVLIFGVAVHLFLLTSLRLQSLQLNKLKRRVTRIATTAGVLLMLGNTGLLFVNQFAIMVLYSSVFVSVAWVLYRRVLNTPLDLTMPTSVSRDSANSDGATITLTQVRLLCTRMDKMMAVWVTCSVLYAVFWFVGRDKRSTTLLGVVKAIVTACMFLLFALGSVAIVDFFRTLCLFRLQRQQLGMSLTLPKSPAQDAQL